METLNYKKLSLPAKGFFKVFAVLGLLTSFTACGNNANNQNVPPGVTPLYGVNCQNCISISSPVILTTSKAQSFDGTVSLNNLQLIAQSSGIVPRASGNNYKGYRGPIAAQGVLTVTQPLIDFVPGTNRVASACVLPAGTYQVQTAAVGTMEYEGVDIFIPALISLGGAIELKIEAPSPMGLLDAGQTLWAKVSIVRINNVICSADFHGEFK